MSKTFGERCNSPKYEIKTITIMMTRFRNSLTWRDTVEFAVSVYSFLILGKGEMTGTSFANIIQAHFDCSGPREKTIIKEIETHVTRINATYKGTEYFVRD